MTTADKTEGKAVPKRTTRDAVVEVPRLTTAHSTLYVLGTRPLICNRMSEKARRELLSPRGRKTAVERQSTLKHNPLEEFRASPYMLTGEDEPTLLALMSSAFKGAMATAALDIPGAKKAQIGRLVWVEGDYTAIYGTPRLFMSVVRSADMNKTPDIRTRAIVFPWAAVVNVSYVVPLITPNAIVNLALAAGQTVGVGDYRPEKGKGTYGQYVLVAEDDERLAEIMVDGGRARQIDAMRAPEPYDQETKEMLAWWQEDKEQRGLVEVGEEEADDGDNDA